MNFWIIDVQKASSATAINLSFEKNPWEIIYVFFKSTFADTGHVSATGSCFSKMLPSGSIVRLDKQKNALFQCSTLKAMLKQN